jgi:hypothetical protein
MTLFLMGFIIFCCSMLYRLVIYHTEKQNDKIKYYSETKTITGGIE